MYKLIGLYWNIHVVVIYLSIYHIISLWRHDMTGWVCPPLCSVFICFWPLSESAPGRSGYQMTRWYDAKTHYTHTRRLSRKTPRANDQPTQPWASSRTGCWLECEGWLAVLIRHARLAGPKLLHWRLPYQTQKNNNQWNNVTVKQKPTEHRIKNRMDG